MPNYDIGLNAILTARQLIDVAGDNIANANTDGYHTKQANVVALTGPIMGQQETGQGSAVESVTRKWDGLVEDALLSHVQTSGRLSQEVDSLGSLEAIFNEPTSQGLDAQIGDFFDSVSALSATPDDPTLREQVVQKATSVCDALNGLNSGFATQMQDLNSAIGTTVGQINSLTEQISYLNGRVMVAETGGAPAPSLEDQRDQLITQLGQLINVDVKQGKYGVVSVSTSGTLLVDGVHNLPLVTTQTDSGLAITPSIAPDYHLDVREGTLGALMGLTQDLLQRYQAMLDDLANDFRRSVNLVQTTGVGLDGGFDSLQGLNSFDASTPFSDTGWGVTAGTDERLVINVTDKATGEVTQTELSLDTTQASGTFLTSLQDSINTNVDHVTASVSGGCVSLQADDGYTFDFATPYDPNPANPGDITAASPTSPTIMDAYTGDTDLTYKFHFLNDGTVGTDALNVSIDVCQADGTVLRTLTQQIDAGYTPGTALTLENGLKYSLGQGAVAAGDGFSFTAHASMDTAGVLDALGLNTFLNGQGAGALTVTDRISSDNSNLSAAISPLAGDNHKLLELAQVGSQNVAASGTMTLNEYYRELIGDLATTLNTKTSQSDNEQQLVTDLQNKRDSVSGVSVDDEMVNLVSARTLYQGAAKYISTLQQMFTDLAAMVT